DGDLVTEAAFEAIPQLRRERDFGHEDQRALAAIERLFGRADVELGLSAPRDPEEQKRFELPRVERRRKRRKAFRLIGRERELRFRRKRALFFGRALARVLRNVEDALGERAVKNLAQRKLVVIGDPIVKLEVFGRENRLLERRGQDVFERDAFQFRIVERPE